MKKVRIGSGGGYAGDRIEPAIEVMEKGDVDAIVFECLAERTIALAQQQKWVDPQKGYNELLEYRMEKILPLCAAEQITVITNMGAANPVGATQVVKTLHVTAGKVKDWFKEIVRGTVKRYELPQLGALNFVMDQALGGGVVRSLAVDKHGKSLSSALLELEIPD